MHLAMMITAIVDEHKNLQIKLIIFTKDQQFTKYHNMGAQYLHTLVNLIGNTSIVEIGLAYSFPG